MGGVARRLGVKGNHRNGGTARYEQVVSLAPEAVSAKGRALVAYILDPFLLRPGEPISNKHTHDWECWCIVQTLLSQGLAVDVISYRNRTFVPREDYRLFFAARTNFQRIAEQLPDACVKVVHLDTAHWLYNNTAAFNRLLDLQTRRGVTLSNLKTVEENWALEACDMATILGNEFTIDTYRYAGKPIHRIPISVPETYEWDEAKNFADAGDTFVWFGSEGFVHKGLDLVVEAFARMPEFRLLVCGPVQAETAFMAAYEEEFALPNIEAVGWVDVAGDDFLEVCRRSVGLVYPTCSEGGGGSALTCMHAGLIPIVSRAASVDLPEEGILLESCTVDEICAAVREVASRTPEALESASRAVWSFARERHSKDAFKAGFERVLIENILSK